MRAIRLFGIISLFLTALLYSQDLNKIDIISKVGWYGYYFFGITMDGAITRQRLLAGTYINLPAKSAMPKPSTITSAQDIMKTKSLSEN